MSTIADRIILLVEKCCSGNRSEFGRKIGLTPAYISKLDKERDRAPSERTIGDICREFNVNEQWLRTGEGEMFQQLTRREELTREFGKLLKMPADAGDGEQLKLKLISFLTRLDSDSWDALAKIAKQWADENEE